MGYGKQTFRKVKIAKHLDGSGGYVQNGYFHDYGTRAVHTDDGKAIPETYAIIELEDGTVKAVEPSNLKFVDSF